MFDQNNLINMLGMLMQQNNQGENQNNPFGNIPPQFLMSLMQNMQNQQQPNAKNIYIDKNRLQNNDINSELYNIIINSNNLTD